MSESYTFKAVSGSAVSVTGSAVICVGEINVAYTLEEKEYINQVLINEIGGILKAGYKWLSFGLITAGIEFLGICLDSEPPFTTRRGVSEERFRLAIKELFPKKYMQFNCRKLTKDSATYDLYNELRCGVNHTTFPTQRVALSEILHNTKHLTIGSNGHLIMVAEDFFNDFKLACEEVIRRLDNGTINPKLGLKFS